MKRSTFKIIRVFMAFEGLQLMRILRLGLQNTRFQTL